MKSYSDALKLYTQKNQPTAIVLFSGVHLRPSKGEEGKGEPSSFYLERMCRPIITFYKDETIEFSNTSSMYLSDMGTHTHFKLASNKYFETLCSYQFLRTPTGTFLPILNNHIYLPSGDMDDWAWNPYIQHGKTDLKLILRRLQRFCQEAMRLMKEHQLPLEEELHRRPHNPALTAMHLREDLGCEDVWETLQLLGRKKEMIRTATLLMGFTLKTHSKQEWCIRYDKKFPDYFWCDTPPSNKDQTANWMEFQMSDAARYRNAHNPLWIERIFASTILQLLDLK